MSQSTGIIPIIPQNANPASLRVQRSKPEIFKFPRLLRRKENSSQRRLRALEYNRYRQLLYVILLSISAYFSVNLGWAQPTPTLQSNLSPVGLWQTIDDISGQPKSIIRIAREHNTLSGTIYKVLPIPGIVQHDKCVACRGELHNQPIIGLKILTALKQNSEDANFWTDGRIIDPSTGKTYRCTLRLIDQGRKLTLHGYIGLPLLGRSQTWLRVAAE